MRTAPFFLVLLAACSSEPPPPAVQGKHLVLITVDTLRADHLGCYGYFRDVSPNLDAFAEESVLFERVLAPMATTLPSHTSLFTGLFPLEHQVLANTMHGGRAFAWKPDVRSFAQMASEAGYETAAFVSAAPLKEHCGLAAGFDTYVQPDGKEELAYDTVHDAMAWLEGRGAKPVFLWVHLYDPHAGYDPPDAFILRGGPAARKFMKQREIPEALAVNGTPRPTLQTLDAYAGEVKYTDAMLQRLFEALQAAGIWDDAAVVVTSDHGEGLHQHDWRQHGLTWEEQLRVPLLIRPPGGRAAHERLPARVSALTSLVDVLPTVLPLVDTRLAAELAGQASGRDALSEDFEERPLVAQVTGRELGEDVPVTYALSTPEWKLLHDPRGEDRLFHRGTDPFELEDVAAEKPAVVAELTDQLLSLIAAQTARADRLGTAPEGAEVDEALRGGARRPGVRGRLTLLDRQRQPARARDQGPARAERPDRDDLDAELTAGETRVVRDRQRGSPGNRWRPRPGSSG